MSPVNTELMLAKYYLSIRPNFGVHFTLFFLFHPIPIIFFSDLSRS